jgi:hypothetical protein
MRRLSSMVFHPFRRIMHPQLLRLSIASHKLVQDDGKDGHPAF